MIFGRRLGCVATAQSDRKSGHNTASAERIQSIHEFVNAVQQIFVDSAALSGMNAEKAYRDNHPIWSSFVQAADRALALGWHPSHSQHTNMIHMMSSFTL